MQETRCRLAEPDDASTIVEFQLAMAIETEQLTLDPHVCGAGVAAVFARPELGRYYVAEVGGVIAGSLMITYEWSDWRNGTVWWIQSVYVRSDFRKLGIFAALYAHVKAIVEREPSLRGIRLYVDRTNVAAQQVYRRIGMNGEHYQVFEWMK